jgi:hypothetical protein
MMDDPIAEIRREYFPELRVADGKTDRSAWFISSIEQFFLDL